MAMKPTTKPRTADDGEDIAQGAVEAGLQAEAQALKQAERLRHVQNRILSIYGAYMTHWMQRRQYAAKATLEAAQRAMGAKGRPGSLPEIYSAWMHGSLERIAADIRECQDCGNEIVAAMQESLPLADFRAGAVSERMQGQD